MTTSREEFSTMDQTEKIWSNSGDSHFLEPADLFTKNMPPKLAERMPRSERQGSWEIVHVDGKVIKRRLPKIMDEGEFAGMTAFEIGHRAPGARDARLRLRDLDDEGIWGELSFPSLGFWAQDIEDPELLREGAKVLNDWAMSEIQRTSTRLVPTASLPLLSIDDAVAELKRCAEAGFYAIFLPTSPPPTSPRWNDDAWEPLWCLAEETGTVVAFHIGTDGNNRPFRGPGGAILNYVETTFGGQRAVVHMVSSGALDRHPALKVVVSEGGATWAPFLGDRMNEAYRQHGQYVKPTLSMLPKEFIYRQVYVSFQHDVTAIPTVTAMGYRNVMWGSDYPHMEGTFGHTQETLHELLDGVDPEARDRMTRGTFLELFPHVGDPPTRA